MNLIQQFGLSFFVGKYYNALFLYNNDVLSINSEGHTTEYISCSKLDVENGFTDIVQVPEAFFTGIEVMSSFKPGWRVYNNGTQASYFRRRVNGNNKGFRVGDIIMSGLTPETARKKYKKSPTEYQAAYLMLKPEIIDYEEGMEMLAKKERLMFTPDLECCVVNTSEGIKKFFFGGAQ